MTDSSGWAASIRWSNPLSHDPALFDMYMYALDLVLRQPEIRQACDEFALSPATLRMRMTANATRVLLAAPQEFSAYLQAELNAADSGTLEVTHGLARDPGDVMRLAVMNATVGGVLMIIVGGAGSAIWAPMATFAEAGASLLVFAGLVWAALRFLGGSILQSVGFIQSGGTSLDIARSQLMAAVAGTELLGQVRTLLNDTRQDRFGHQYSVVGAPGLSEVYDSANQVPTNVASELDDLLGRLDGASIGVAGPRGSGKSALIRHYCDEIHRKDTDPDYDSFDFPWLLGASSPGRQQRDLRSFVAAPVDYVARDFVLHLFATFCRAVIGRYGVRYNRVPRLNVVTFWLRSSGLLLLSLLWRAVLCTAAVLVLLHWKHTVAGRVSVPVTWVLYTALAVICLGALDFARSAALRIIRSVRQLQGKDEHALARAARQHLSRVRYLQTYTSGWSGTLQFPGGHAGGQYSRSMAQAEQPHSYPEIVDEFRNFARDVAAEVHLQHNRVFIGIDELDKIGSAEQAEHFLNEIKGIFGIPHIYFMVSVSDDALTAFERRGLPLRNAFDSSFDEIMHIGPLSYQESRRLLYRRVIGLSEPYAALCHCIAGGLPRDTIRAARQVVRAAISIRNADLPPIQVAEGDDGIVASAAYLLFQSEPEQAPPFLSAIATAVIQDKLFRKLRAVGNVANNAAQTSASPLHDMLYHISQIAKPGQSAIHVVDLMNRTCQGEPIELTILRLDLAAYAYYCATLQEVFTDQLDRERIIAATSFPAGLGNFDALAAARAAFSVDTLLAWRLITQFRKAWSMETREPERLPTQPRQSDQPDT